MQTGVSVDLEAGTITGTLNYVTGYTGFSGETELQSGNYLALAFTSDVGAVVTFELINGHSGPVTLDSDMNIVVRLEDKDTQKAKIVAKKSGKRIAEYILDLSGLVCETA